MKWKAWTREYRRKHDKERDCNFFAFIARLKNKPCFDCDGWFNPWQMHFDHRIPSKKSFTISWVKHGSLKRLLKEIKKCDVVCANCHADRTHYRKGTY